jgi:hypothetical protein
MTSSPDFPAEFQADRDGGGEALRWTVGVIVPTAFALALLNAEAIASWTHDLPASPRTAKLMTAADAWHARTAALALHAPRNVLHRAWKRAEATGWPAER